MPSEIQFLYCLSCNCSIWILGFKAFKLQLGALPILGGCLAIVWLLCFCTVTYIRTPCGKDLKVKLSWPLTLANYLERGT